MGTNYYRKHIPTEDEIKLMHQMIDEGKFESKRGYWSSETEEIISDDVITSVSDLIDDVVKEIHLCKMSMGWQVGFDHNWGKYYNPSRESINKFLSEPNTKIVDEYGEDFTVEEFWRKVDEHNASKNNTWDSESYNKWEEERAIKEGRTWNNYLCKEDINKCKEYFSQFIKKFRDNDFESVDGLRFAVFTDFS